MPNSTFAKLLLKQGKCLPNFQTKREGPSAQKKESLAAEAGKQPNASDQDRRGTWRTPRPHTDFQSVAQKTQAL
jgi:hypothetical protein